MKLPTDPKTRTQILAFAGLILIFLLYLSYFGLSTITTKRKTTQTKLVAAVKKLTEIDRTIKALPALRQSRDDLFWNIQSAATNYILYHEYRNYHLTARETLLPLAAKMGVTIDIPKEGVIEDFPIFSPKTTNTVAARAVPQGPVKTYTGPASTVFALYPVTLSGRAGYAAILAFLNRIESTNPYMAVSELRIQADPKSSEEHEFSMTLLWPIWKTLEQKPKIDDLIDPSQDYDNASESP